MTVLGDGACRGMLSLLLPVAKLNPHLYIVNMAKKLRGGRIEQLSALRMRGSDNPGKIHTSPKER
jgi:hypothetical protein